MLITTLDELRLCFPTHAIDTFDPFVGVIDNSEHEFLLEKLGAPLYNRLCQWYDENQPTTSLVDAQAIVPGNTTADIDPYNRLLLICQRCVAYDAMARAVDMNLISINNAGINIPTAGDYGKVDLESVRTFKAGCVKEAHSSINRLLQTLEEWCQQSATTAAAVPDASPSGIAETTTDEASVPDASPSGIAEITTLWRQSRYYYLAAQLLIPSALVLEEYLPFYQNREKFIQLLPDLNFIQEELITDVIGEDFCALLTDLAARGTITDKQPALLSRILRKLRKITVLFLEGRTTILKIDKERKIHARDEAVRLLSDLRTYCVPRQETILKALDELHGLPATAAALLPEADRALLEEDVLQSLLKAEAPYTASPYFVAPPAAVPAVSPAGPSRPVCCCTTAAQSHSQGPLLVTPPLL
jgi:hypothetical protein